MPLVSSYKGYFPVLFGSLTDWKVVEMMPTQIYVLQLLKNEVECGKVQLPEQNDFKRIPNPPDMAILIKKLLTNMDRTYLESLKKTIPGHLEHLHFLKDKVHFNFFRQVHQFNEPEYVPPQVMPGADSECI